MWLQLAVLFQVLEALLELYLSYRQLHRIESTTSAPDIFGDVTVEEFSSAKAYEGTCTRFSLFELVYRTIPSIISSCPMHRM